MRTHRRRLALGLAAWSIVAAFPTAADAAQAFQESGGQVVMEAEMADVNISRNGKTWTLTTTLAGESGAGYLTALPNSGTAYASAGTAMTMGAELQYQVQFSTTGTYYIWVRGYAGSTLDDAIHAGLNGESPSTADKIKLTATGAWNWTKTDTTALATSISITSAGLHTIHFWMNEDGMSFDKIVLTSSSTFTPTGIGPAESPRITVGGETTPPTVSLTAPSAGATVSGSSTTVSATASDNVGVVGVQFRLDGVNLGAEDSSSPYSIAWDTTSASNGSHSLTAIARDAAGNMTTSPGVSVTINNSAQDTSPPTGSISINAGALVTSSNAVTLTLSATDSSGVSQMQFSNVIDSSYSPAEPYAATKQWTLSTGDGAKTVYVKYKDAVGNWSAAISDTITLDTAPPIISDVSTSNIMPSTATITWTTNDVSTSQIEYGTTTAYGQATALDAALVTNHNIGLSGLSAGTLYHFRVRSRDAAANESFGVDMTFTTAAASGAQAFQESNGEVVFEAEHYDSNIARNGIDWALETRISGYSGTGHMTALPNGIVLQKTNYTTSSPELIYTVQFATAGTYYLWVRGAGGGDDSYHAGIDNTAPPSAANAGNFTSSWGWNSTLAVGTTRPTLIVPSPGTHTIHIWMRHDGFPIDKILLRTDPSSTAPSGTGPVESPRVLAGDAVPVGSITINGGAASTTSVEATLTLSATDNSGTVAQMKFSNDNFTYTSPEPYATTRPWSLTPGNGTKTVYARFADAAGNWSTVVNDTIALDTSADTTPPSMVTTVTDDGVRASSYTQLHAVWTPSSDPQSGIASYLIQIREVDNTDGSFCLCGSRVVEGTATEATIPYVMKQDYTFYIGVQAQNGAGMVSTLRYSDGIRVPIDLSDAPDPFSPNEDGVLDTTTLSSQASVPTDWTLMIRDSVNSLIRSFTASGTTMSQTWNGTNASGAAVPDGVYTYQFQGTAQATGVVNTSGPKQVTVDRGSPTAVITSPSQNQVFLTANPIPFSGTATDSTFQQYTLSYGSGSAPTSFTHLFSSATGVTNGVLYTLNLQTVPLAPGTYTFRLTVLDKAGNESRADRTIVLDSIQISNIAVTPSSIDPYNAQLAGIGYALSHPANVTLRIYQDISKQLIRTFTLPNQPAGPHQVTWDGKRDTNVIAPLDAYYFTIEAADGTGRTGAYNNATAPLSGPTPFYGLSVDAAAFDPYRNDVVSINYTLNAPGRVTINILDSPFSFGSVIRTLLNQAIRTQGPHTEYWDGRRDNGALYQGAFGVTNTAGVSLPLHPIILSHSIDITAFRAEAYLIQPVFGEVSLLTYTLSHNATVSVTLTDPNGNMVRTLLSNVSQVAGPQNVEWNGLTDAGSVVAIEGNYTVTLTAADPASGLTFQRKGTVVVYR